VSLQDERTILVSAGSAVIRLAHPLDVGEELVLSNQTKGTVAAVGGGVFYAVTVFNAQPPAAAGPLTAARFTWEGGGVI
jgi:hypothetical protein